MEHYVIAQMIGLIGYIIIIMSSFLSGKERMIKAEMIASIILSLQWALLFQPAMVLTNMIGIAASVVALSAIEARQKEEILRCFYPFSFFALTLIWQGTIIDILALGTLFCMITSRRAKNETAFCFCALTGGAILMVAGSLAFSLPAIIFNFLFMLGHLQKLCTLVFRRQALQYKNT